MDLRKGDYVEHIGFPEVFGQVSIITQMPNDTFKIGVFVDDANGGRIFYDMDDKWELDSGMRIDDDGSWNDLQDGEEIIEVDYEIID